jgi:hypothetical protein
VLPHVSPHEWHDQRLAAILRALDRATTGGATEGRLWPTVPATVFRFLLDRFATVAGDRSGEFYTPTHLVRLMVVMTAPRPTERIYDPSCGSGETLIGAVGNVDQQVGAGAALSVLGQALSARSWRLAKMNLAIHGITPALGPQPANPLQQHDQPRQPVDVVITPTRPSTWPVGATAARQTIPDGTMGYHQNTTPTSPGSILSPRCSPTVGGRQCSWQTPPPTPRIRVSVRSELPWWRTVWSSASSRCRPSWSDRRRSP